MEKNLKEACLRAKQNSTAAENNYKRTLDKMNSNVEFFHIYFTPLLNKIQESDVDLIEFVKFNLEKFCCVVETAGGEMQR